MQRKLGQRCVRSVEAKRVLYMWQPSIKCICFQLSPGKASLRRRNASDSRRKGRFVTVPTGFSKSKSISCYHSVQAFLFESLPREIKPGNTLGASS